MLRTLMVSAAATAIALAGATTVMAAETGAASPDMRRFDGTWGVTLTCDDFKDEGRGAKGYTFRFLATVQDGKLRGEHGTAGQASWLLYEGTIHGDGSAEIRATGLTGKPDYVVTHAGPGTRYSYRLKGEFDSVRGRATRLDLRPCVAVFVKQ